MLKFLRPTPQWAAIALDPSQRPVTVHLGDGRDLTDQHGVASLRPLIIALGTDAGENAVLELREGNRLLGVLHLAKIGPAAAGGAILYRVAAGDHRCQSWPSRSLHRWRQDRAERRRRPGDDFRMEPAAARHLAIAYIRPRPVVLVSVAAPGHFNMFPMDLIGAAGSRVTLALRITNVSIPVMRDGGGVVLSCLPAEMKPHAYALAERHGSPLGEGATLPFATRSSSILGIPSVGAALRVRELIVRHAEDIGSHIFFTADILSDDSSIHGAQLHHVPGFYQAYRRRHGLGFPEA